MIRKTVFALLAGSALATAAGAAPGDAKDLAERFGARERAAGVGLSPDGTKAVLTVATTGSGTSVVVADLVDGSTRTVMTASGTREQVGNCRWASNARLVCNIYLIVPDGGNFRGFTRQVIMDADGKNAKQLSAFTTRAIYGTGSGGSIVDWNGGGPGKEAILMSRWFVPQEMGAATGLVRDEREGFGIEAVDVVSLKRSVIEKPRLDAGQYITDGHGVVRVMGSRASTATDYIGNKIAYHYRKKGARDWHRLSEVVDDGGVRRPGFVPVAVDSDQDVVYGFDLKDGRRALYKVSLDGSERKELVLAHDRVDIDGVIRIGRQRRVVGATYATDVRHAEYFDPALGKLRGTLGKALGGAELLTFVDASADEGKLLIHAGSDVDPGRYLLFDKASKKLSPIVPVRPELAGMKLAPMRAITFKAADGTAIPAYLTLPPGSTGKGLPAIVMPHGGPDARDEWGFDWLPQFFAARGFAVLQPNFRGSAGYGDDFFLKNGFQSWRTAIGDVNDAGRYLVSAGIAAPGKLAIFGWSYGGYAALQSAVLDPDLYKAIVAVAPVTDLPQLKEEGRNYVDFPQLNRAIGTGPEVVAGSPAHNVARIKAPVLMFHGDRDLNVDIDQARVMRDRMKGAGKAVTLNEYPLLDHQLSDSRVRAEMLEKSDAFIRAALGM